MYLVDSKLIQKRKNGQLLNKLTKHKLNDMKNLIKKNDFLFNIIRKLTSYCTYKFLRKTLVRIKLRFVAYLMFICLSFLNLFNVMIRKKSVSDKLVVLVPNKFKEGSSHASGSNKDIESMLEDLDEYNLKYVTLLISRNPFFALYEIIFKYKEIKNILSAKQILVSMPGSISRLLLILRMTCRAKIIVRVHNAELFHRLDYVKLTTQFWLKLRFIKKSIQGLFSDFLITIIASRILQINDYEMNRYWSKLNPFVKSKNVFFPYKPPFWVYHEFVEKHFALILGSFDKGTLTALPAKSFLESGQSVSSFAKSNNLDLLSIGVALDINFNYEYFDYVENLSDILKSTKVLLVPSGFGWGFKTKIGDALFLNQVVIVPRELYIKSGIWRNLLIPIDDWSKIDSLQISNQIDNSSFTESIKDIRSTCIESVFFRNS